VLYVEENKPKKMKKINYLFIIFVLFLFVSCKSKKNVVSILPRPVLNVDSVRPDSSAAIDGLFAPDHSQLADLKVSTKKQKKTAKKEAATEQEERNLVLRGTKITSSTVNVPATYSGIDRVVEYDFTHRDVPEAFEGFRIAFISDLHYKSLLKEKGLNNLVDLLIAQKPDVLLMGGDYQEGCEYVEPLFAALARVKTPMGTFGVMGNNDYERCHDEIIRTMKHYGMRPLEHEVDTLRKADYPCRSTQSFRLETKWGVAHTGAFSQRLRYLVGAYSRLRGGCFGGQHGHRFGGTYSWWTGTRIRLRPDTELPLRHPLSDRTGVQFN
jgi:predicted phosphodiesterase